MRLLGQAVGGRPFPFQPMQYGEQVSGQHEETALERIWNLKALVEHGKPRLRHNRAIEFGGIGVAAAPRRQGIERVQSTAGLV